VKVEHTSLPGVIVITPVVHTDPRGAFRESWQRERYAHAGLPAEWVQDNVSVSHRRVLRGLHFQYPRPQGKLVTVLHGEILDVAVDVRRGSPAFGRHVAVTLSASNGRQLWVPEGFAHGFVALADHTMVHYKVTQPYHPGGDRTIQWDDPEIGIAWRTTNPLMSAKDAAARRLSDFAPEELPPYEPAP
jgi:dTDP-4-dehydrorhamnose 3,5-epimerase